MADTCRFFSSGRGCNYGDRCHFQHVVPSSETICRYYSTPAGCVYGNRCRFVHSVVSENGLLGSSSFAPLLRLAPTGDSDTDLTDNQTNVNNECSGRNSPECSETGDKVVTDEKTSHHKELSELSSKVQSCSLLKNSESKKKKPGKKRNKKSTLKTRGRESKGKELVLAQKHVIKCGECSAVFSAGPSNADNWNALKAHYVEKFGRNDAQHVQLLRKHSEMLECCGDVVCFVCCAEFTRLADLFQHLASKCRDVNEMVAIAHRSHFDAIVLPFVERDAGFVKTASHMLLRLRSMVSTWNQLEDEFEFDDSDSDGFPDGFLNPSAIAFFLARARHQHEFHESDDVDDDGDDDECDEGMCGFSASDCEELLCQGIKPWDPEAGAALMVLNGFVD